jgi:hypothetical protein
LIEKRLDAGIFEEHSTEVTLRRTRLKSLPSPAILAALSPTLKEMEDKSKGDKEEAGVCMGRGAVGQGGPPAATARWPGRVAQRG